MNANYYFGSVNVQSLGTKEVVERKKRYLLNALKSVLESGLVDYRIYCDTTFTINGIRYNMPTISTLRVKNTNNYVFVIQSVGCKPHTVTLCDNPKLIKHISEEIDVRAFAKLMQDRKLQEEAENKRKEQEIESFETLYNGSEFLQMNVNSRQTILQEIRDKMEFLEKKDKDFMNDCFDLMTKLSGTETAAKFVEFMKTKLETL